MIRNKLDFFNSDGKNKNNHGYDQKETTILHYKVLILDFPDSHFFQL